MAKEGLYSERSGSENHTKESTQAADKTHRRISSTHMQMTWIVRVAHAANGRTANKALLAANTFICVKKKKKKKQSMQGHTSKWAAHARRCLIIPNNFLGRFNNWADLSERISVPRHYQTNAVFITALVRCKLINTLPEYKRSCQLNIVSLMSRSSTSITPFNFTGSVW